MTDHTRNMLAAFHLATYIAEHSDGIFDISVAAAGDRLFGEGWTPLRRGRSIEYAPLVSMTLGRMRAAGLVRAGEVESLGGQRYRSWTFTAAGRELAEEMFGSAEYLEEAFTVERLAAAFAGSTGV